MELPIDLESLSKRLIFVRSVDTPDTLYTVVPNIDPQNIMPTEQVRLEPYIRLKSLPLDVMKLVLCITEARSIANKVTAAVPFLPAAVPTHYPSGVVELQWRLDAGGVFGVIIHGFSFALEEGGDNFVVTRKGRITWRFHGPGTHPQKGEFKSVEELIEFMGKCFIQT